ncbi:hypothetical protein LCGC14_2451030 [marine sediment metagenome]|uniref:Uncharacterized protein n=1 Tax=marine sediment metagenome TaxID=412755 RepID=A0A0F9BG34_9ZZZZ
MRCNYCEAELRPGQFDCCKTCQQNDAEGRVMPAPRASPVREKKPRKKAKA